jgi:hypothetical protein
MSRSDSTRGQNSSAPATTPTSGAKPSRKSGRNAPSCRQATPRNSPHNSSPGGAGCARPADQRNARGATAASARFQDELGSMRPSQLYPFSRRPGRPGCSTRCTSRRPLSAAGGLAFSLFRCHPRREFPRTASCGSCGRSSDRWIDLPGRRPASSQEVGCLF